MNQSTFKAQLPDIHRHGRPITFNILEVLRIEVKDISLEQDIPYEEAINTIIYIGVMAHREILKPKPKRKRTKKNARQNDKNIQRDDDAETLRNPRVARDPDAQK